MNVLKRLLQVKKAMGGILLVDEAYYLYNAANDRDYGQESIEILLNVMENNKEDIVVVLAGYKDRMDKFYGFIPGMNSRIGNHIEFPNYGPDELVEIAKVTPSRGVLTLFKEVLGASYHVEGTGFSENCSSNKINSSNQVSQEPEENSSKFERKMQGAPDFAQEFLYELRSRFGHLNDGDIEFTNTGSTGDMRVRKLTRKIKRGFTNCVLFQWQPRKKRFLMYSQLSGSDLGKFDLSVDKGPRPGKLCNITFLTEERLTNSRTKILDAIVHAHKVFKI